jgi:hypothetical protein
MPEGRDKASYLEVIFLAGENPKGSPIPYPPPLKAPIFRGFFLNKINTKERK